MNAPQPNGFGIFDTYNQVFLAGYQFADLEEARMAIANIRKQLEDRNDLRATCLEVRPHWMVSEDVLATRVSNIKTLASSRIADRERPAEVYARFGLL